MYHHRVSGYRLGTQVIHNIATWLMAFELSTCTLYLYPGSCLTQNHHQYTILVCTAKIYTQILLHKAYLSFINLLSFYT